MQDTDLVVYVDDETFTLLSDDDGIQILIEAVGLSETDAAEAAQTGAEAAQAAAEAAAAAAAAQFALMGTVFDTTLRADGKTLYYDASAGKHKYCWASPLDRTADLRDFMDMHYGVGEWAFRTTPHSGDDIVPAASAAFDAMRSRYGWGKLLINSHGGYFRQAQPMDVTKLKGMTIDGGPMFSGRICCDFTDGTAFDLTGFDGYTAGGMENLVIVLEEDCGDSNVYCIKLAGDTSQQPDNMRFKHLRITSLDEDAFWYNGLTFDGSARILAPKGIRIGVIDDIEIFRCRNTGAFFQNIDQWTINNLGVYVPKVGTDGDHITITGNGTDLENSDQFNLTRFYCSVLHLNNCRNGYINGYGDVHTDTTATYMSGFIEGIQTGTFGAHSNVQVL